VGQKTPAAGQRCSITCQNAVAQKHTVTKENSISKEHAVAEEYTVTQENSVCIDALVVGHQVRAGGKSLAQEDAL